MSLACYNIDFVVLVWSKGSDAEIPVKTGMIWTSILCFGLLLPQLMGLFLGFSLVTDEGAAFRYNFYLIRQSLLSGDRGCELSSLSLSGFCEVCESLLVVSLLSPFLSKASLVFSVMDHLCFSVFSGQYK